MLKVKPAKGSPGSVHFCYEILLPLLHRLGRGSWGLGGILTLV